MNDKRFEPRQQDVPGVAPEPLASLQSAVHPSNAQRTEPGGAMRMGAALTNVPPPGARMAPPARRPAAAHGALPPGGRRATLAGPAWGAATGAAVWSARQGGAADGPAAAWATPVGATSHPEFKPSGGGEEAWATGAQEEVSANAKVRGPVLWGLVLLIGAALVAVALWLARSVSTERDLAALARFASLPTSPAAVAPPGGSPATPPVAAPTVAAPAAPGPIAAYGRDAKPASPAPPPDTLPDATGPAAAPPAFAARPPASQTSTPEQTTRKPPSQSARTATAPSPIARDRRLAERMTPREREYVYAQVFKRCPPPGVYGALQCRKRICNGAEGLGPACRHINRLKL